MKTLSNGVLQLDAEDIIEAIRAYIRTNAYKPNQALSIEFMDPSFFDGLDRDGTTRIRVKTLAPA